VERKNKMHKSYEKVSREAHRFEMKATRAPAILFHNSPELLWKCKAKGKIN
jgi:hypothetical protein